MPLFADLAEDLYAGDRAYIGELKELYPLYPKDPDYKPMMDEFRKLYKDLKEDRGGDEEWFVDERYQLVYDLLIKHGFAERA